MAIIWSDPDGSSSVYSYISSEISGVLGELFKIDIYMQDRYYCEIYVSLNVDDATSELIYSGYGGTTVNWTPPISVAADIMDTDAAGYTFSYSIRTRSNGDILNAGHKTIYFKIPFSPTFTSCDVTDISGYFDIFGKYIQYESQIHIKAKIEIDSLYGAPLQIGRININNSIKNTTDFVKNDDGTYECTIDTTSSVAGTISLIIQVMDTRGVWCNERLQISVMSYDYPIVTITNPYRCNASGDAQYDGEYACTILNASVNGLDGMNSFNVVVDCTPSSTGSSTTGTYYGGSTMRIENQKIIFPADINSEYTVTAKCTDKITNVSSLIKRVLRVTPMIDIDRANNSFGFGIFANEPNTARFGPEVMFEQGATFKKKVIFEQGSNLPIYAQNLLDNSDFTNLVNQGNSNSDFVFDRWHGSASSIEINAGVGITISSGKNIIQRIPSYQDNVALFNLDATFTLAAMTTDGTIYMISGKFSDGPRSDNLFMGKITSSNTCYVGLYAGSYKWVALYEGVYNEGTLPVYRSKGYSEELKKCKQFYQKYDWITGYGAFYTNNVYAKCPLEVPMRSINPTLVTGNSYAYRIIGMPSTIDAGIELIELSSNSSCMCFNLFFGDIGASDEEKNKAVYVTLYDIVLDATL